MHTSLGPFKDVVMDGIPDRLLNDCQSPLSPGRQQSPCVVRRPVQLPPFLTPRFGQGSLSPSQADEEWMLMQDPRPTTCPTFDALLNCVNVLLGVSILALPFAIRQAGWMLGVLLIVGCAVVCAYTAILLGRVMRAGTEMMNYADTGRLVLGPGCFLALNAAIFCEIMLGLVSFILLMSDSLHDLFPGVAVDSWIVLTAFAMIPACWIRDYSKLAWISFAGIVVSTLLFCFLVVVGLATPPGNPGSLFSGNTEASPQSGFCASLGILLGAFGGGHALFPSVYSVMQRKSAYSAMIAGAFLLVACQFLLMGAVGYRMFGEATKPEIHLNLDPSKWFTKVVF
eukprot:TRINITY_DN23943_c0_g1_i3.p1 TRINITY_DN23943_c0_g1~~TRINITY_DN23943_c0_g1_i3.p1  ORF type:complete len:347 (+),score=29.02 TRINITY_DN23943_c0_g1_i3:22-1041(+)